MILRRLLPLLLLIASMHIFPTSAIADTQESVELRAFLNAYDVPEAQQDSLLRKLHSGDAWDSMTPGAEPIATETRPERDLVTTVERYSDGSITVSSVSATPTDDSVLQARGVSQCQRSGSAGYGYSYTNCFADVNRGVVRMYFYFNWSNIKGASPTITRYWGRGYHLIGGAFSNHRFIKMSTSDVRYAADFSVAFQGFPVGWTAYMGVRVGTGVATTYNN